MLLLQVVLDLLLEAIQGRMLVSIRVLMAGRLGFVRIVTFHVLLFLVFMLILKMKIMHLLVSRMVPLVVLDMMFLIHILVVECMKQQMAVTIGKKLNLDL